MHTLETKPKISIIIPAFNEEEGIVNVLSGLKKLEENYEIIVIDDGSTDRTSQRAEEPGVSVIKHLRNKGYGASLKTGIRNARAEVVLFLDADAQHDPNDIKKIIDDMDKYDMVVGARGKGAFGSWLRWPGKKLLSMAANYLAETKIPDLNSGLRAVKKDIITQFIHILPNTFSFSTTLTLALIKGGYEVKYVPITTYKRLGKSSVNILTDGFRTIMLILRIITLFDPLKVFLPPSLALLGGGIGFGLYTLITEHIVWKSGLLLIFSGIMIFFFGLLADQIANIRREIRGGEK